MSDDTPTVLTPQQVADGLSVSRHTVYRWIREGELDTTKVGNEHRIFEHHLASQIGEEEARAVFESAQTE